MTPVYAAATDVLPGPVPARVVRVIDGDTVVVRAHIWPRHRVETAVRLSGVDTPELRGGCPEEKRQAKRARNHVKEWLSTHAGAKGRVHLTAIELGKYAGRVVARVAAAEADLSDSLLQTGLARRYDDRDFPGWCP